MLNETMLAIIVSHLSKQDVRLRRVDKGQVLLGEGRCSQRGFLSSFPLLIIIPLCHGDIIHTLLFVISGLCFFVLVGYFDRYFTKIRVVIITFNGS